MGGGPSAEWIGATSASELRPPALIRALNLSALCPRSLVAARRASCMHCRKGEGFPEDYLPFKDLSEPVNAKY